MKGLLISAPSSNQGKTVISVGLLGLLRSELGLDAVVGAKAGPDYIDTAYLGTATAVGLNLDPWAMRPETIMQLLRKRPEPRVLIEGTMGLFDGSIDAGRGSSADLAKLLNVPVVLIVNVGGMSQSAAAVVHGFASLDPDVTVAGVIFNRVGSERHESMLRDAMAILDVPVLGAVPRSADLDLGSRHLGLVQAGDQMSVQQAQSQWAEALRPHVDLAAIVETMAPLAGVENRGLTSASAAGSAGPMFDLTRGRRLAVADDAAFRFCYGHWKSANAITFSPLANQPVPHDAEFVFLPGGYPELHLETLARADVFWRSLRAAADAGVPIYGECGGYMVLGRGIQAETGEWTETAGLLPLKTSFKERRRHLGYRRIATIGDTILSGGGRKFRGHEFHYCSIVEQDAPNLFSATDARGEHANMHGHSAGSVVGSFMHLIDDDA